MSSDFWSMLFALLIYKLLLLQVLECCWEELLNNVREASDLDHVIAAHETFLDQVMTRSLLDNESRVCTGYFKAYIILYFHHFYNMVF